MSEKLTLWVNLWEKIFQLIFSTRTDVCQHYVDKKVNKIKRDGLVYSMKIWDTIGRDLYTSLATNYLCHANCVYFVYAINERSSLKILLGGSKSSKIQITG